MEMRSRNGQGVPRLMLAIGGLITLAWIGFLAWAAARLLGLS